MVDVIGTLGINPSAIGNTILLIGTIIVVGTLGIIAFIYFFYVSSFTHKFRIREVISGRTVVKDTKARNKTDKDGVEYWQLMKYSKERLPVPPPEAIDIDFRGKKCVEAFRTSTGEFQYIHAQDDKVGTLQPLTTTQRLILINQIKKAQERKRKRWQDYLPQIVYAAALLILVVSLMIFYEDMGKPLLQMGDKQIQLETMRTEQLNILKEIKHDVQVIQDEMNLDSGGGQVEPPN